MAAVSKAWRVWGAEGHRQRVSFQDSFVEVLTQGDDVRVLECRNADKTGTNDYTEVIITRNTVEECECEFLAQLSDGIFETSRVGKIEEIPLE